MTALPTQGGFLSKLGGLFGGGLGSAGMTPEEQQQLQRAALFQAGLATLASAQQPGGTLGGSLFSGFQAGAGALQQAQQNAFQSKRIKQQEEREARLEDQQNARIKIAQAEQTRKDREQGSSVARRLSTGLSNAKGRELEYLQLVGPTPEFQAVAQQYGIDPQSITTPEQAQELAQQLGALGGLGADPDPTKTEPLETIVGEDGKPILVPRTEAVNRVPYIKPSAGVNVSVNNNPTGEERKGATLALRLESSLQTLKDIEKIDASALSPTIQENAVGSVTETGANFIRSPLRQQAYAVQLDGLDAALTLATGAAYTKEQIKNAAIAYFPQVGDDPDTVALKNKRYEQLVNSAYIAAGRAAPQVGEALKPRGPDGKPSAKLTPNSDGSFTYTP